MAQLQQAYALLASQGVNRGGSAAAEGGSSDLLRRDRILHTPPKMSVFELGWSFETLGTDHRGRLVVLDRLGTVKFDQLLGQLSPDEILACYACRMEQLRFRKLELARQHGVRSYYHTTIIDAKGTSLAHIREKNRSFIQSAAKFASVCYPETVHRILIVNAPAMFPMLFRLVRTMMDPETADKIQVLSGSSSMQKARAMAGLKD